MKLKRLIAENVYSFKKIDIRLDEHSLVQVTGDNKDEKRQVVSDNESESRHNVNGVGKSNIYNTIIQALYSRDIYKTKKSFLKNMYTKGKFCITLELNIENTAYKITYSTDECILFKEGNQFISGRAAVTEFFENLIPFDLFLNLTYISSTITFPFFVATPTQQKQFIELVFSDLNKFKESIPKLKDKLSEEVKEKNKIDTEKEIYTEQASIEVKELITIPEIPETEDFSTELHNVKTRITQLENIDKERNSIKKALEKELKIVEEPETTDLQERLGKGKGLIEATKTEIKKLEKVSKDKVCPICGSIIDIATNFALLNEKLEYLNTLETTLEKVKEDIKVAQAHKADYKKYCSEIEARVQLKEKLSSTSFDERELIGLKAQVQKIKDAQEEQSAKVKEAQSKREQAIAYNEKVKHNKEIVEKAQQKLEALAQQDKGAESTIANLKLLIEICDKVIVGKQIPKRLEILERFINIELANFTSQYKVKLEMDKVKIKPSVIKDKKTYPFENISTGEKARINVSLIFAIRNILTRLNKDIYNINLLYVDELVGTLDFSGKHLLLETLKSYNLNIFLVSHDYVFPDCTMLNLVKHNNKTEVN